MTRFRSIRAAFDRQNEKRRARRSHQIFYWFQTFDDSGTQKPVSVRRATETQTY